MVSVPDTVVEASEVPDTVTDEDAPVEVVAFAVVLTGTSEAVAAEAVVTAAEVVEPADIVVAAAVVVTVTAVVTDVVVSGSDIFLRYDSIERGTVTAVDM